MVRLETPLHTSTEQYGGMSHVDNLTRRSEVRVKLHAIPPVLLLFPPLRRVVFLFGVLPLRCCHSRIAASPLIFTPVINQSVVLVPALVPNN
jgi:hypothetical protein